MGERARDRLRGIPALSGTIPHHEAPDTEADPLEVFDRWLDHAVSRGVPEPHVMTLATVDDQGIPDARPLVLRDLDSRGWAFASTLSSRKGTQLRSSAAAALSFWWPEVVRAVRVRGTVVEASRAESDADLARRSPSAQATVAAQDWTLWRVVPERIEFWQGSPDRRHVRTVYTPDQAGWTGRTSREPG